MSDEAFIRDQSDLRKYRIEIPNVIDDWGLSVYAFRLYVHYKRVAGAAPRGFCQEGTRASAAACKMAPSSVSAAKNDLEKAGLISIERSTIKGSEVADKITIIDIWPLNFEQYIERRGCSCGEHPCSHSEHPVRVANTPVRTANTSRSNSGEGCSSGEHPRSPDEHNKKEHISSKEDINNSSSSATRIPANWTPTPELLEWAQREFPGIDAVAQAINFADYWRAESGARARKCDWSAAFRTWIRNKAEYAAARPPATPSRPSAARPTEAEARADVRRNVQTLLSEGDGY